MKNKDTVKELAELCKKYASEIMENTDADDEYITYCAYDIFAHAGLIIDEIKKELEK